MKHRLCQASLYAVANIAVMASWTPAAAQSGEIEYNLAAQPLADTLKAISLASGANILATAAAVEGKRAPDLIGRFSAERAVELALLGSGLHARATPSGLIVEPDFPSAAGAPPSQEPDGTTIVVTGTRIRGAPIASPVITLTENSIRNSGQATLGEVVRSIPQSFGGGQQPGIGLNVPGGNGVDVGGGSSINLRGLGSDATLTLLNGHRLSYNASRQAVDVSSIPLSAIDRLEIVPDGASAIYGSDAVAGVANIILKRDYRGLETRARLGASTDGGNFTQQYGALGGETWQSGGVALAYEHNSNNPIRGSQRSYARVRTPGLTLFPSINSHNALLTGHQAIVESLTFSIDVLYNHRDEFSVYPEDESGDLARTHGEASAHVTSYAVAPSLEWVVGESWRLTLGGTIGQDRTHFRSEDFTGTKLDFSSTGCYCNKERSIELSGSGGLATLPAGDIKVALGTGYRKNQLTLFAGTGNQQNFSRAQDSYYAYAEVSLPIVAPAMAIRGIDRLSFTGAVRYERYPGIGDVATPKLGLILAPTEAFDVKASWGKSFRAPTLRQEFQPKVVTVFRPASLGGSGFPAGSTVLFAAGGNPALEPERATSWSATLAIHPPSLNGARLELSYFDTRYRDRIVTPIAARSRALVNAIYRDYVALSPSAAQVASLVAAAGTFINASGAPYDPATVVAIADNSNVNAGRQRIHGVDALLAYRWDLGGADRSIDLSANASYLSSDQRIASAQPTTRLAGSIFNPPHFRARGGASWQQEALTLTATVSYIGGVDDDRTATIVPVGSMTALDLAARYRTAGSGLLGGIDITLAVQNVLNDKPDTISGIFLDAPYDSTNYSPVGRFVSLSVAKTW